MERFDPRFVTPAPPLAGHDRPIVLTTRAEVEAAYERPEDFFAAGWTVEWFGEQILLSRCQDVTTRADVFREIRDHQWAMARAAKPGLTRFVLPRVTDELQPIFDEGRRSAYYVGTNPDGGTEYSCVLRPGAHLPGWEIFELVYAEGRKQLRDGTPITSIRVVFLDEWMAHSEKRPLLDHRIRVYYIGADGEDHEVTDESATPPTSSATPLPETNASDGADRADQARRLRALLGTAEGVDTEFVDELFQGYRERRFKGEG
jgi:hypothetical protein